MWELSRWRKFAKRTSFGITKLIKEIHIIHHSHTDFGYTDLPSTIREQQVRYIGEAIAIARKTEKFSDAARFRWTCEVLLPVADFLEQATPSEKRGFDRAFQNGQIELGAMPAIMSGLMWTEELDAALERLRPIFKKYRPPVVLQNDVNGMPWGLLPRMRKAGARYAWMGINRYSGFSPMQRPALWWWEGPDGDRTLTYLNYEYTHGYDLFYPENWRRGPVPHVSDVWYHPPEGCDIWDDSASAVKMARSHCLKKLGEWFAHWPFPELAIQTTNQWRHDNDGPCAQLPKFVRSWNAAGLTPKLRLSTPSKFLGIMEKRHGKAIPAVRGDWQDWWDDGATSMPAEVAVSQRAKRLLADLDGGKRALRSRATIKGRAAMGWREALLFSEHTYAPFDCVAQPYSPQTVGHCSQSIANAYHALEHAKLARMELVRSAPAYIRSAQARHLVVLNPGKYTRSGWAEIKATALRFPANAVRDVKSGEVFPLEDIACPQWSEADPSLPRPFEVPNDAWNFGTEIRRLFVCSLSPGETRTFEFIETNLDPAPSAGLREGNSHHGWEWNKQTGRLNALSSQSGPSWIDADAPFGFGEPVIELPQGFGAWTRLMNRTQRDFIRETPRLTSHESVPSHFSARFLRVWEHANFHRIQQTMDIFHGAPIVEIETTFWFKEVAAPQAVLLAFPFSLPGAKAIYHSMGWPTEAGTDQLPGSCAEHALVGQGVDFSAEMRTFALSTPDTPVGCFGDIRLRTGARASKPDNAHFYSLVSNSYWMTNFPITKAAKVSVRHRISAECSLAELTGDLWAFPGAPLTVRVARLRRKMRQPFPSKR